MELNRVLGVDDDPAIRRVVCALLDLDEYGLLEAADGDGFSIRNRRGELVVVPADRALAAKVVPQAR